jgi:L-aspartate oxidase
MTELDAHVLVVGSGIAGLSFALKMAAVGDVLLLTKKERTESNTNHARGGIAAVLGQDDDAELHMRDTFLAGAGLCHGWAVEALVREGPDRVRELASWGTAFDLGGGGRLALGREGGHSRRRIAHAGDQTGWAIETALLEAVAAESRIRVLEDHLAVDLLLAESSATDYPVCRGILALDHRADRLVRVRARATLLAAGGCGQVYRYTTNPSIATGDGIAMAYRAGARMANMEFIQFHPTALHPSGDPAFLISEALRGEGAILRRIDGEPFMERYHPLGSLAPRDVVALAIDRELKESGDTHVVLDVSALPAQAIEVRFANTIEGVRARGIEPLDGGIPVVPAAHYVCGGVLTDGYGATSLPRLYAAGEVACTGVHGANRLASNSLLEAVVFSHRAAQAVTRSLARTPIAVGGEWAAGAGSETGPGADSLPPDETALRRDRQRVRGLMWELAGIVRDDDHLSRAEKELAGLGAAHEERWLRNCWTADSAELRNLLEIAALIVRCARSRRESRGLHHTLDHPWRNNERFLRDTVVRIPRP